MKLLILLPLPISNSEVAKISIQPRDLFDTVATEAKSGTALCRGVSTHQRAIELVTSRRESGLTEVQVSVW